MSESHIWQCYARVARLLCLRVRREFPVHLRRLNQSQGIAGSLLTFPAYVKTTAKLSTYNTFMFDPELQSYVFTTRKLT